MFRNDTSSGVRRRRPFNLQTALILYVLLPMSLASGLGTWWSLRAFEQQVETRMQNDLEMVARAIERPLSHALLREREGSIAEALKSVFDMSHVYGAYLYDKEGRIISDTAPGEEAVTLEEVSRHVAEGEVHGQYGEVGGRYVYSYFLPLTDAGGRISGLLQLTRRYTDFEAHTRKIRLRGGLLFFLSLTGLTGAVMYGHHQVFGKHLQRFMQSMSKIAEGDLLHRYEPGGPVEMIALGNTFNRMMDHIERAEHEIELRRERQQVLEARLRQSEKMAAIGELAAGVAHELGTPLSLIDAQTQRALRRHPEPGGRPSVLGDIRREVQRMEHIIRQLLDFSRRHHIQKHPVEASQLARSALSAVKTEAHTSHTRLAMATGETIHMAADRLRVEQALVNLLRNGIQATPGGTVELAWFRQGHLLVFAVTDNGHGISTNHRSKVFEPFFTTKPVGQGTGLGLAVVHGIAAEHGGQVEIDETHQPGARFLLSLPLNPPGPGAESPPTKV